ncbi:gamma-glutamyltransferase [Cohnella suwonensis]|uniref:Glutathione hydrolase proenzyme n=1 Tax=Cohnella suwonensis TaxID=696072 RepID=A0ABW0LWX9_9BACL
MNRSAIGANTMVVSPHRLASEAGDLILSRGGNAFDSAVAVSACLAVVYPHMTGLGGDCFWLTYAAGEGRVRSYNGSGRSGRLATREAFAGEEAIPRRGVRSAITVPGMVDGWAAVLEAYGRMTLADVLEPAIGYARDGFPMSKHQHGDTASRAEWLAGLPLTRDVYLPGGQVPAIGSRFVQERLADSLKAIAEGGRDVFYKGDLAHRIVAYLEENGGLLTMEDLALHSGQWVEPLRGAYRGYDIYQVPPNSQGFVGLMALNILERFDIAGMAEGSADYYHLLVEALKLSFRDRDAVLTDPDFASIPLDRLLSEAHASKLAGVIDTGRASLVGTRPVGHDTAYAAVADGEGNSVSFIQSLYFEFGSGVTAGDTGILLQNRGSFFSLDPTHVNTLEPNKRTFHTLMPAMACKAGKPAILYGTQGGEGQPQTQTAMLTRMIDYGMDPQRAIDEPRFVWGRTWGEDTQELKLENRVKAEVAKKLSLKGHSVRVVEAFDSVVGHAHAIAIAEDGTKQGGADPRSDGAAVGR